MTCLISPYVVLLLQKDTGKLKHSVFKSFYRSSVERTGFVVYSFSVALIQDNLSAVDILSSCNLVNYFGKVVLGGQGVGQITLNPILIRKVMTAIASSQYFIIFYMIIMPRMSENIFL